MVARKLGMASPVTDFDVPFSPVAGVDLGPLSQLVWGKAGVLAEGLRGVARRTTGAFVVHELNTSKQQWVARSGDFLWVGPDKSITLGDGAPATRASAADKHAELSVTTQSAWDPARGVLVRFGGVAAGTKFSQATREWKDGEWRESKVKTKPTARSLAAMCWVPTLGGVVMVGGWNKKDGHLGDTAVFDGKDWTIWPAALPEGAVPVAPAGLFFDESSAQLILLREAKGRAIGLWRYAGEGRWELAGALRVFPEIEDAYQWGTPARAVKWAFDGGGRVLLAASALGGLSAASIDLGPWLDALPRPTWDAVAKPVAAPAPVAPRVPRRYLVSRGEGVGKYWFAALEGSSWTARWGQRGRPAQSKTYELDSEDAAARDFDKKVREKLDKGYAESPAGERAAQLEGATAYPLALVTARGDGDFVHGAVGVEDARWPTCRACHVPMKSLGVFHAHPDRLPLAGHAALALFQCERGCAAWDPDSGANAALLLDHTTTPRAVAPAGVEVLPVQWVTYEAPVFELDHSAEGLEDLREPGGSKVGGTPTWVQSPQQPSCDVCASKMRLAVQLDSADTGMNFGDMGLGYAFVCSEGHQAKLVTQGS
jgi:predicted DNA-binding WGR domain protein